LRRVLSGKDLFVFFLYVLASLCGKSVFPELSVKIRAIRLIRGNVLLPSGVTEL
jgi:hypothetical protein